MRKDEVYLTYLLLSPTKGMDGIVDNKEGLFQFENIDSNYLMSIIVLKRGNKLFVLGTDEIFDVVYNHETPIKFIRNGLNVIYPSDKVGIRLDNTDKGTEIICNYLKIGKTEITKSIDKFYFDGMAYYSKNKREKEKTLRINK